MSEFIGEKEKATKKKCTNCNPYLFLHIKKNVKYVSVMFFNTPGEIEPPPSKPHNRLSSQKWKVRGNLINSEFSLPHERKRDLVK